MGGLGVTRMTRDSAAVAAMSSAASALARVRRGLTEKRPGVKWAIELIEDTLKDPRAPRRGKAELDRDAMIQEPEGEDEGDSSDDEPSEEVLDARQAREEEAADAAQRALRDQERADLKTEGAGQTVLCTLRKGWAVATRRRAKIATLRGKAKKRHEDLTTTHIKVKGEGAEPRKVTHRIPESFESLVTKAAKDNNKLQHKINVHEHALTWISIFEKSKQDHTTTRRLEDCLLPGTRAAFTAIPSCKALKMPQQKLAFRLRMQFGLEAKLGGFHKEDAYRIALTMGNSPKWRNLKHDACTDALLDSAVASNLVACREPERHFQCHNGTDLSVCPDGIVILEDGTPVGFDVTFAATAAIGKRLIREKRFGHGSPRDRQAAQEERAAVHAHIKEARARGDMTQREAQNARYKIGLKLESSYHSGYDGPLGLGGGKSLVICLSYFGGWRSPIGEAMDVIGHTGDEESDYSFEERFDHRGKTWASTTHRQFSLQAVAVATVNATFDWVASESKRVLREVLQVREKERRLEVTPPVACARPIEAAARDDGDKATGPYDDIGDDVDLGAGDAE
jgi:hypothetical protein